MRPKPNVVVDLLLFHECALQESHKRETGYWNEQR